MSSAAGFPSLLADLNRRASGAVAGLLSPRSPALRAYLREGLHLPPGSAGSFLADPVFEATFGWRVATEKMTDLVPELLHRRLVEAMDSKHTDPELVEQRFPKDRNPYVHQVQAWRQLRKPGQSVLVSSGTGSGKTECFAVPVLDDLVRECEGHGRLTGVRALFLYPLNALIASQRDRLLAWTRPLKGDVRFCLYNGLTSETVRSDQQAAEPARVLSRKVLREDPPPLLVTNGTMLEYMLVRKKDEPIIRESRGKLRWVILDEAHSYLGSTAAELALLLKRVLHAFEVEPDNVHFVATSATMGGGQGEAAREKLAGYLADLAGVSKERVTVLGAEREVPTLPLRLESLAEPLPEGAELQSLSAEEKYRRLAASPVARGLRRSLTESGPRRLSELVDVAGPLAGPGPAPTSVEVLEVLNAATNAENGGTPFLPLRMHVFQRTQRGMWACTNGDCPGRNGSPLDSSDWGWGRIFLERRQTCPEEGCGSVVLEVLICRECGQHHLAGEEATGDESDPTIRIRAVSPAGRDLDDESAADDVEVPEDDEQPPGEVIAPRVRLLTEPDLRMLDQKWWFDPSDGRVSTTAGPGRKVGVVFPASSGNRCGRCAAVDEAPGSLIRAANAGAAFLLEVAIPTLLEAAAGQASGAGALPSAGKRILTFSDSRQGTARLALRAQLDAERTWVRSAVYHGVWRSWKRPTPERLEQLEREIVEQRAALGQVPAVFRSHAERAIHDLEAERLAPPPIVPWKDVVDDLAGTFEVRTWIKRSWDRLPLGNLYAASERDAAEFLLARELFRRPKRQNSLETLGLLSVVYTDLNAITTNDVPAEWRFRGQSLEDWKALLRILLNYFLRAQSAVIAPEELKRWCGFPVQFRYVVAPGEDVDPKIRQMRWPGANPGRITQMERLVGRFLRINVEDPVDRRTVDALLVAAWEHIRPVLKQSVGREGFRLELSRRVSLAPISRGWLCPVTRRVLDDALGGLTPFAPASFTREECLCQPVEMPRLAFPLRDDGTGRSVSRERIQEWLDTDTAVRAGREAGYWSDVSDRLVMYQDFFRAAEHSAQQNADRLATLEKGFKAGEVNLLACSTTMEMGVDIGGLSTVGMTNVPPSPANFLQRAGRAGRRGETRAVTMTLCPATPHSEAIFRTPHWPFRSPIEPPRASLQSRPIVQRHLNALLLSEFVRQLEIGALELKAGWFFVPPASGDPSPAEAFRAWLLDPKRLGDKPLVRGIKTVCRNTPLALTEPAVLVSQAAKHTAEIAGHWLEEWRALGRLLDLEGGKPKKDGSDTPAQIALSLQMQRQEGEFLLGELTSRCFLPTHGFPVDLVEFVTLNASEVKRLNEVRSRRADGDRREESFGFRKGFPSRDLPMAIREYAPGNEIVIDGQVHRSSGVTLNWQLPASDENAREIQAFRVAWRCRTCRSTGTRWNMVSSCPECGESDASRIRTLQYLKPAGFAVDFREQPGNTVDFLPQIPVESQWISAAGGAWVALPNPAAGRFRHSGHGHVFFRSRGALGFGYAICLHCGRAASETDAGSVQYPEEIDGVRTGGGHPPLRGTRGRDRMAGGGARPNTCEGTDTTWGIKRRQALGAELETDVFELQLRDSAMDLPVSDPKVAHSVAVALRRALAEYLGIEDREIGWAAVPSRDPEGKRAWSVTLFDRLPGGAGFVAAVPDVLPRLLARARELLLCPRSCDVACHACLLTYDTQFSLDQLDRKAALDYLSEGFLSDLELPEEARVFGPETRPEHQAAHVAIARELRRDGAEELRLYLGGDPASWDVPAWNLRSLILQVGAERASLASNGAPSVKLLAHARDLRALPMATRSALATLLESTGAELIDLAEPTSPTGLLAELGGPGSSVRWASIAPDAGEVGPTWGMGPGGIQLVRLRSTTPLGSIAGRRIAAAALRPVDSGTHRRIEIASRLDGDLRSFGARFWKMMEKDLPLLGKWLEKAPATSVVYEDRYVSSPLTARLVFEVLRALAAEGRTAPNANFQIVTGQRGWERSSTTYSLRDDWSSDEDRQRVLQELFKAAGLEGNVRLVPNKEAFHFRRLTVMTPAGTWDAILDWGFGFLVPSGVTPFRFDQTPEKQARALLGVDTMVRKRMASVVFAQVLKA